MNISSHSFVGSFPLYKDRGWANSFPPTAVQSTGNDAVGPTQCVDSNTFVALVESNRDRYNWRFRFYTDDSYLGSQLVPIGFPVYQMPYKFSQYNCNAANAGQQSAVSFVSSVWREGYVSVLTLTLPPISVHLGQLSLGNTLSPDVIGDEEVVV